MLRYLPGLALLTLVVGLSAQTWAQQVEVITYTCRCVTGGVNQQTVQWLNEFVIPTFEERMAAAGRNVDVQFTEFGGSDEALKQQYALDLSVGRGFDVIAFDGFWVPEFAEAGLIKALDEIIGPEANEWEGWDHIAPSIQNLMGFGGKRYGIPVGTDVRMIFYNRELFVQAGIPQWWAWQPHSWEELLATARQIKAALPDVIPLQINAGTSMGEATTLQGYYLVLLGTGEQPYDFATNKWVVRSPGILRTLQFYKQIYIDEGLGDARTQLLSDARARTFQLFSEGKIAMLVEGDFFWRAVVSPTGSNAIPNRDTVVGWAAMPATAPGSGIRGQDFVTASGGTGNILNPNSANPQLAWELLTFMNSQEGLNAAQQYQARIRARDDVPVPNEAFLTVTARALLPFTTTRPGFPVYSQTVSPQIQLMTERVVSGEFSPREAMEAYALAVIDAVGIDDTEELPGF
ncbi:MAG: extracellular solute-binding protein [Deinococcus sp.]|nr:extracellular solute-binding protein [Deinococcus sp.]